METAADDLGLNWTGQFLNDTVIVHKCEEKQPFINRPENCNNINIPQQSFYEKYRMDILKLRTPVILVCYHYLGYLYTVPYLPISQFYIKLLFIPTTIILFMTYLTFWISAYSHPGRVPIEYLLWDGSIETKPRVPIYSEISESKIIESGYTINPNDKEKLFCKKCEKYRPLRTHHCSACNYCVCRMDHHCWFLNNCVGINNHRYFFQFLLYVGLILLEYEITYYVSSSYILENESYLLYLFASFMFYVGILLEIFITGLFITNMRCVLNNQTYLEQKIMFDQFARYGFVTDQRQYDKGTRLANFKEVFGECKFKWFLPLSLDINDVDKRLMNGYSMSRCDLLPCFRMKSQIVQP